MTPKLSVKDAAMFLGQTVQSVYKQLTAKDIPVKSTGANRIYIDHNSGQQLFNIKINPTVITTEIVKGGVGKTSITFHCAVRASLYGLKVAMIDLDQQANLTRACRIDTNKIVAMIDAISNNIPLKDNMIRVADGLDLFPSKFENALLSTTLVINTLPLHKIFKELIDPLRRSYDLIFIDCPPDLDATVTAAVLAADFVLIPIEPDEFSVSGFCLTNKELKKIEKRFDKQIPIRIVMNKYDNRTFLSHKTLAELVNDQEIGVLLFKSFIRNCQEFSNILIKKESLFDSMRASPAKEDIDSLTKEIIEFCYKK